MDENVLNETNTLTPEDSIYSRINEEMQNIDNTINGVTSDENSETIGLRQEVEELAEKLADDSNYIVTLTEDERLELELINEEIEEIHRLEKVLPRNIEACDKGINLLNKEIADISTRLRKHNIAVEKGYFSQLSEEDVATLQAALADKTTRLESLTERKEKIQTRFDGLGDRLKLLLKSQEKLNKISNGEKIDKYQKLLDKSRYDYLKSGLEALENRKAYIEANKGAVYSEYLVKDQNDEIAALKARIAELESGNKVAEEINVSTTTPNVEMTTDETLSANNAQKLVDAYLNGNEDLKVEESTITTGIENNNNNNNTELQNEEKIDRGPTGMIVAPPTGMTVVDQNVDPFIDIYSNSKQLDDEREAEIEEAEEILKEKKKEGFFKKHLRRFLAAGAAAIALLAATRGCTDMRQIIPVEPENTNNDNSYSSTDEGITEKNNQIIDEKYEIPSEQVQTPVVNNTVNTQKPSDVKQEEQTKNPIQEEIKPTTPAPEEDLNNQQKTPVTPEEDLDQTIQTGKIELNSGEKIIGMDELGNIKTVEHGDEVGTEVEFDSPNGSINVKLEDYKEGGTAEVTHTTPSSTSSTKTEQQQVIENILKTYGEENNIGMFDPAQFDENGNWIGDLSKGRGK